MEIPCWRQRCLVNRTVGILAAMGIAVLAAILIFPAVEKWFGERVRTTALVGAAAAGQVDVVSNMLACGADVNGREVGMFNWTPLMAASFHGATETVDFLLDHGADPYLKDHNGLMAVDLAINNDDQIGLAVVRTMIEHGMDLNKGTSISRLSGVRASGRPQIAAELKRAGARE